MVAAFSKYSRAVVKLVLFVRQLAVTETDAQVEEGEVRGDLGGLDELIDGVAVVAPRFQDGAHNAVGIHGIRRQLPPPGWHTALAWSHFCWSSSTSA